MELDCGKRSRFCSDELLRLSANAVPMRESIAGTFRETQRNMVFAINSAQNMNL